MSKEKLFQVIKRLEQNNFETYFAPNIAEARDIFRREILEKNDIASASYGDSETMMATGVLEVLRQNRSIAFLDTFDPADSWETRIGKRREALTVDLFLAGSNAITEAGQLVNLDMIGNRVAALTFGPRYVALFAGRNKIVRDLDAAFIRIKTISAPANAKLHTKFKTPCQVTGTCEECRSPQRICNSWTITEKSFPPGRIKIILIDEELGL